MHLSLCACMCPSPHAVASDTGSNAISHRSHQSKVERQLPRSSRLQPDESIYPPRKTEKTKRAKLLPTEPEWVMYYWCVEDMYRTKIFTWVTHWRAIFERVFFFFPWKGSYPRGIGLGLLQRSRFPWNIGVVWVESIFSGCFQDSCIRLMGLTVFLV